MKQNKKGAIIIEGHVQGLANTRSLGTKGIPVYVIDSGNCVARYSKYCKKFFKCPDYKSDEIASFLIKLAKSENIKDWVLIPSNDHAVYTIAKHKVELEKYYKVITEDFDIVEKIYDKSKLLEIADSIGLPIPKTCSYDKVQPNAINLQFPILTRGKEGKSFYHATGKKAFKAKSIEELYEQLEFIENKVGLVKSMSQELIPYDGSNKTISFTAFCEKGHIKTYWMGVKLREHPIDFGTATFTESVFLEDCLNQSKVLLKELKYTGVCEVEYLRDPRDDKYKLIEINPRTWLWVGQAIANGIDFPSIIYNYVNCIKNEYPSSYETGLKWYNPYTDLIYGLLGIWKKSFSIKDFVSKYRGEKINCLTYKNDNLPAIMYGILLIKIARSR